MLISIIFIVIWCLLIISNIITLVELFKVKKNLNKPDGKELAKSLGIKDKLKEAGVVNIGLYNKKEDTYTKRDAVDLAIKTIQEALTLFESKDSLFVQQSMKNRIDIDKAERFLTKVIDEAEDYRY